MKWNEVNKERARELRKKIGLHKCQQGGSILISLKYAYFQVWQKIITNVSTKHYVCMYAPYANNNILT